MGTGWSTNNIPTLSSKRAIVTGANCGIGYYTALALGAAGAEVIIACRSQERGIEALHKLRKECPGGKFELRQLDLSSLGDIARFADAINAEQKPLDILINNAGVMYPPYEQTKDGFELQLGTNHLGHFALTGRLMRSLLKSDSPRVVTVSSTMAWWAYRQSVFDFVKSPATYNPVACYTESKIDNLLFMRELGRRYPKIISTAAHPGASNTNLLRYRYTFLRFVCQSAASGALPTLMAATEPSITSGTYFGPRGFGYAGYPVKAWLPSITRDDSYAKALWSASEKATGVEY